jgi:hypothetical protein
VTLNLEVYRVFMRVKLKVEHVHDRAVVKADNPVASGNAQLGSQ